MTPETLAVCTWASRADLASGVVEELLTLGRSASDTLGIELRWLVLGPWLPEIAEIAATYGVTGIDRAQSAKLDTFQADPYVEALAQYCARYSPRAVLFSQTFDARLVAPRLAGRLGSGVVMNGVELSIDHEGGCRVTASAYGGDTRAVYAFGDRRPHIVAMMPGAVTPAPASSSRREVHIRDVEFDLATIEERIRVVEPARAQGPRLEDAKIIVAGGRGLGSPANYQLIEQLAEAVGGVAAASRPIVDDGWVDPSRQIGLTGKIVRPALYIAAGVSGASQHMAGCSAAKTIVAINRDADAAIFRYARYGVVGDCLEILPELIRAARSHASAEDGA